jgi:acyl-[acyl-carrier-protein]-phospholipid O-acyltransferase/long-chain-fatty-acid--[acyl-carrier-protein] ligase
MTDHAHHVVAQDEPPASTRGFWALIATQFTGAFNDNALKFLVIYLILSAELPRDTQNRLVPIVLALFAIPWLLFSMAGGYLADRYSKRSVTIGTKVMEAGVMSVALVGLALGSIPIKFAAIFLLNTQAALFSASKYGILPELLPEKRLSWGNGVIELTTFLGIITGTMAAGNLAMYFHGRQELSGLVLLGVTATGLATSLGITRVPAKDPEKIYRANFIGDLLGEIRYMRKDRVLWLAVLGNCYLFFLAALLQPIILLYGKEVLHLGEDQVSYLQAALAVGIGLGSLAAGYLSENKIEYGLIPLGSLGMTIFSAMMWPGGITPLGFAWRLGVTGFFAGFYAVPLQALIQHRPEVSRRGGVIGAAGMISWLGISASAGVYWILLTALCLTPSQTFLVGAALTFFATIYTFYLLPDSFVRLVLWFLTHTVYRIRVAGRDNIPERGGALFVSNHMSWVDALLLIASTDRPIRFLMFKDIYENPAIKPLAKILRAIPISSTLRPREMIRSLRDASQAIADGEVVCIFAEGQITRVGHLLPFRRGFERIMKGVPGGGAAPIVPVALDGVWGSIFSFERGRFLWKLPRKIPYPVTVSFGAPLPPTATAFEVRKAVEELAADAYTERARRLPTLDRAFLSTARSCPFRFAMADGKAGRLSFGAGLARAVLVARRLRPYWEGQQMVGILLPPSVPGALVNYAALLAGKVPVNLNYTLSSQGLASCARQCGLKTVVTAKALLERVKIDVPGQALYLDEVAGKPGVFEKLAAFALAWLVPERILLRALGQKKHTEVDDVATVIFSSGSTGEPKGVLLSHGNIAANVEQIGQTFFLDKGDRILGILPFFHSFGFTVTLMLPAVEGIGVVFHLSPLDARAVGALVEQYGVTFLLSTPTFLQAYLRRTAPEQFGSLAYVLVGAEKLPERVAQAFEDTFGIRPLEGYGATECSPVVTVNAPDFRSTGFRQVGQKRGRIGHPLPGVSVRIVDPDTFAPLGANQPGLLLVRGPNVMLGYLGKPEKTAEVLRDGWYVTGDIASQDEDGFLTITDRLSRFSKIGGEMVPHGKIEEKLQELAGATEQVFAVSSIPDEKKGERIVVLHTLTEAKLQEVLKALPSSGLPNLWIPRANQFFHVDALPYLGTGKLDLRLVRDVARGLAAATPGAA